MEPRHNLRGFSSADLPESDTSRHAATPRPAGRVNVKVRPEDQVDLFLKGVHHALSEALTWPDERLRQESSTILDAARHICLDQSSKRLRPRLVLCAGQFCRAPVDRLLHLATAAEFLHASSLLHDDVIDHGVSRRNSSTANALWGNTTAVLAGDLLLSLSIKEIQVLPRVVTAELAETITSMSRGVMAEVGARGSLRLSNGDWKAIAQAKTGALFAFAAQSTAHLSGRPELRAPLRRFGIHLGIAFQIADDLLELLATDRSRCEFNDLRNKEVSFPVLLAAADRRMRADISALWEQADPSPQDLEKVGHGVLSSGAVEKVLDEIDRELDTAVAALGDHGSQPAAAPLLGFASSIESAIKRRVATASGLAGQTL